LQQKEKSQKSKSEPEGTYPAVGAVYGFPTAQLAGVDRTPALLEEPVISEASLNVLLGDSKLVLMKDRDLVPDALFVAMAQMKVCQLTEADRVGCYKAREIGFTGMSCKHCEGQPGFGRYFPNSVRSLAQTTTSQTILKHVGSKCLFCPPHVRQALIDLQRQQAAKEGIASGRPRYGSRKIFFQRVWARLRVHGKAFPENEEDEEFSKSTEDASHSHLSSEDDERSNASYDDETDDERYVDSKAVQGPKSTKRKKNSFDSCGSKRPRIAVV